MKISKNAVVTIDYAIRDVQGSLLEDSSDEPLSYIQGTGVLAPGLEDILEGKEAGFELNETLEPEKAFGSRDEELVRTVNLQDFQDPEQVSEGLVFHAELDGVMRFYTVKDVGEESVVIDGNHPFAGETLNFEISVKNVRDATPEELDHGHVHGEGGHHHDH